MRMVGCVIRVADRVYPLSGEPEWRGFAWVADENVGICVVAYLNKRLGRAEQLGFSHVVPDDGAEWLIAEEQAEETEGWVSEISPQFSEDFYVALSPAEIDAQERADVRLNMLAIRAAIRLETLPPEDLQRMAERVLGMEEEPEESQAVSREDARLEPTIVPPIAASPIVASSERLRELEGAERRAYEEMRAILEREIAERDERLKSEWRKEAAEAEREVWVRSDDAATLSGLSPDALRKRAQREGWTLKRSGQLNCYRLVDLKRAWPNRFTPDKGGK